MTGDDQSMHSNDGTRTDLIVMAKPAIPGRVKTRLADDIGERAATELYDCFLQDLARQVGMFVDASTDNDRRRALLAHSGGRDQPGYEHFWSQRCDSMAQGPGDLGEKLSRVTRSAFDDGADRVFVIGTDSPTVGARHFAAALDSLQTPTCDVVLGPAFDGGYYLVGLDSPTTSPFRDIDWSSRDVLKQTLRRCRHDDLVCELLEFWYDVDTLSDLQFLRDHLLEYLNWQPTDTAVTTARWLKQHANDGSADA